MKLFKRNKNPYPRSFAKRLTWRVMLIVIVVMGLVSFWFFFAGWASLMAAAHYVAQKYLEGRNEMIWRSLSEIQVASANTVPRIEDNLDKPDKMYDIMENMVRRNPSIRSCGVSFAADYYAQKGHWFCPYAQRSDSDSIVTVTTIGDKRHDYLSSEWFAKAMTATAGGWSKPFFDGQDKHTPLISWLSPIRDRDGQTVAVLGVDLALDFMADRLQVVKKTYRGEDGDSVRWKVTADFRNDADSVSGAWDAADELYAFVLDGDGNYLVHPDRRRVINGNYFDYAKQTTDTLDDHIGHLMVRGESGFRSDNLMLDGVDVDVLYMPLGESGWSVAWVAPTFVIKMVTTVIASIFVFFILLGLLVVFFAGRRSIKKATKSLKQLAASADEVAKGNFNAELPKLKCRDEIQLLRDSFEKMQLSLTAYVRELQETTAQKASLESELRVAHDIQMSMLPKTFPPYPERADIDIFGTVTPAKDVGGDLFDFFIRNEQLFFCIGDVSGKGVPASLVMAVTRSLFRNIAAHVSAPQQIVGALNKSLSDSNEPSMFVTLFVGVLDLATGLLTYSNAGHNAPLLIGRGVGLLPCDANLPLGVMAEWEFSSQQVTMEAQTTIFLYTDGLNEAENNVHEQFGDDQIVRVAKSVLADGENRPETLVGRMSEAVQAFVGEAEQSDDLTMLAVKYL